jgi:hypothetical protein
MEFLQGSSKRFDARRLCWTSLGQFSEREPLNLAGMI